MTILTVTTCTPIRIDRGKAYPFAEAVTEAYYCRPNTTSGRFELGNATTAAELGANWGLLCDQDVANGDIGFVIHEGLVDLGEALAGLSPDDPIYVADTDGRLTDDPLDATVDQIIGRVTTIWNNPSGTPDLVLYLREE